MNKLMILALSIGIMASCTNAASAEEQEKAAFVESEIKTGCVDAGEPEELCACLASAVVTDIPPGVLTIFHKIISEDGVEELNHGDWMDGLSEELKAQATEHLSGIKQSCEPE